jgi:hypothetical protein
MNSYHLRNWGPSSIRGFHILVVDANARSNCDWYRRQQKELPSRFSIMAFIETVPSFPCLNPSKRDEVDQWTSQGESIIGGNFNKKNTADWGDS